MSDGSGAGHGRELGNRHGRVQLHDPGRSGQFSPSNRIVLAAAFGKWGSSERRDGSVRIPAAERVRRACLGIAQLRGCQRLDNVLGRAHGQIEQLRFCSTGGLDRHAKGHRHGSRTGADRVEPSPSNSQIGTSIHSVQEMAGAYASFACPVVCSGRRTSSKRLEGSEQ